MCFSFIKYWRSMHTVPRMFFRRVNQQPTAWIHSLMKRRNIKPLISKTKQLNEGLSSCCTRPKRKEVSLTPTLLWFCHYFCDEYFFSTFPESIFIGFEVHVNSNFLALLLGYHFQSRRSYGWKVIHFVKITYRMWRTTVIIKRVSKIPETFLHDNKTSSLLRLNLHFAFSLKLCLHNFSLLHVPSIIL